MQRRRVLRTVCHLALSLWLGWLTATLAAAQAPVAAEPPPAPVPSLAELAENVVLSTFDEPPKSLDPATSYWTDEAAILGSILEPPFQYDYLARPLKLIPGSVVKIPTPVLLDAAGQELPANTPVEKIARVRYDFEIRKGMKYQPHPCFAQKDGQYLYHNLAADGIDLKGITDLNDPFFKTGSREVTAADFVYQIKRMADPRLPQPCPLIDRWCELIDGYEAYQAALQSAFDAEVRRQATLENGVPMKSKFLRALIPLDLNKPALPGVQALDATHFRIELKKPYPMLVYWMALNFFAPTPWEATAFYAQQACLRQGLSFHRFPVGSGPFYIVKYDPAVEIRLARNRNFLAWQTYPAEGAPGDREAGLLVDAGKPLPFVEGIRYLREPAADGVWQRFCQGTVDFSGISRDHFDQVVQATDGGFQLQPAMVGQAVRLTTQADMALYYLAFNMRDPVVGAVDAQAEPDANKRAELNEKHRRLRLAVAIAIDMQNYLDTFVSSRGQPASGPLPPGVYGAKTGAPGVNPYTQVWDEKKRRAMPRPIEDAKKLLAEAGYPDGINPATGKPLVLRYSSAGSGRKEQATLAWYVTQFQKIGIEVQLDTVTAVAFDDKIRKGQAQLFTMGWFADYPDPENFLFLLTTREGLVDYGGENRANYSNPEFDRLFDQMKIMANGTERQVRVDQLVEIARHDSPWVYQFSPIRWALTRTWLSNQKPHPIGHQFLKFVRLDAARRAAAASQENPAARQE